MKKLAIFLAAAAITALATPAQAGESKLALLAGAEYAIAYHSGPIRDYDRYWYDRGARRDYRYRDWQRLWRAHAQWHRHNDLRRDRHYRRDHARLHRHLGIAPFEFHYRDRRW